ncbi:unknown [Crocosphaera subtropica ATCC 51142]|uniref:CHAD domain-containing protein n=1 Tax=Crocosphaera subtropica (strain ATCC 51142 / BH68) TaxID=43989 RepID=B1X300_CROS5|nr:unknown [Crocosphaera subtropica ATCC 51142]
MVVPHPENLLEQAQDYSMTYRLKGQESIPRGIKRIAQEQREKAIVELTDTDKLGIDEAVHQARKRLKKIRAVLRLVRNHLQSETYKQENTHLRDLGRSLANLRDRKVLIETLDNLTTHFADTVTPMTFTDIRRELQVDYHREYQRVLDEDIIISVQNQLKDAENAINNWEITSSNWSTVDKSLKRVYKRGYKSLHRSMSEPSAENLHEWRKRVKYLRYQLRILRPIWSEIIEEWVDQTHDLSDYLGEDHDLAILKKFILNNSERFDIEKNLETLTALIDRRRGELQLSAIFLGQRIYTEKPTIFIERLGNYWQIWREETQ